MVSLQRRADSSFWPERFSRVRRILSFLAIGTLLGHSVALPLLLLFLLGGAARPAHAQTGATAEPPRE